MADSTPLPAPFGQFQDEIYLAGLGGVLPDFPAERTASSTYSGRSWPRLT